AREHVIPKEVRVEVFDQTSKSNTEVLESFQDAITNRLIDCPYDHQLEQELRFAMITNGKLEAPETGPCTTDDLLDAVSIMNFRARPASWVGELLADTRLGASQGPDERDEGIFDQLRRSGEHRRPPEGHNPARPRRRPW